MYTSPPVVLTAALILTANWLLFFTVALISIPPDVELKPPWLMTTPSLVAVGLISSPITLPITLILPLSDVTACLLLINTP